MDFFLNFQKTKEISICISGLPQRVRKRMRSWLASSPVHIGRNESKSRVIQYVPDEMNTIFTEKKIQRHFFLKQTKVERTLQLSKRVIRRIVDFVNRVIHRRKTLKKKQRHHGRPIVPRRQIFNLKWKQQIHWKFSAPISLRLLQINLFISRKKYFFCCELRPKMFMSNLGSFSTNHVRCRSWLADFRAALSHQSVGFLFRNWPVLNGPSLCTSFFINFNLHGDGTDF